MEIVGAKPAKKYTDGSGKTHIEKTNPAGVDFVVDTVEIFLPSSLYHTIIVGAFSGSNPFTSQDSVSLGTVWGAARYHTYTGLSVDFSAGDRIGAFDNGSLSLALPLGSGFSYTGNAFDAGAVTFGGNVYGCLIYGSGEIATVGSRAFMHYYRHLMAGGVGRQC